MGAETTFAALIAAPQSEKVFLCEVKPGEQVTGFAEADEVTLEVTLNDFTCDLSTADGVAFITNPSVSLVPYIGCKITMVAGGKTLVGWVKAAGSGETYAAAIIEDLCAADGTASWVIEAGGGGALTFDTDHYNYTCTVGGGYYCRKSQSSTAAGVLYKASFDIKNGTYTGASINAAWEGTAFMSSYITTAAFVSKYGYKTAAGGGNNFTFDSNTNLATATIQIKNVIVKPVTAPDTSGCTYTNPVNGGVNANIASWTCTITKA